MATPLNHIEPDFERLLFGARIMALRALRDRDIAEEIAHEALARVFGAWRSGQIREARMVGAYLCTVANNLIIDEARRRGRMAGLDRPERAIVAADCTPSALDALVTAENVERLRREIMRLNHGDRWLLMQIYEQGLSCVNVAVASREKPATIRKRLERALEKLRRALTLGPGSEEIS